MSCEASIRTAFTAPGTAPFELSADIALEAGETLVVLGPSGSGKTLLLESIAGFHEHIGRVWIHGADVTRRPPEARGLGYVFQHFALFPHLTAEANARFGLRYRGREADAEELLRRLGIGHLRDRFPPTLSGGEQQRVSLARALAVEPRLLLLDEPLSSLDRPAKEALRHDLRELLDGVSAMLVTHDRDEARVLGDRVAVMSQGRIVQSGPTESVFDAPADDFVAAFLGYTRIPAELLPRGTETGGAVAADVLCLRPEAITLVPADDGRIAGRVEHVLREGAHFRAALDLGGTTVEALVAAAPTVGERVGLSWRAGDARWVGAAG